MQNKQQWKRELKRLTSVKVWATVVIQLSKGSCCKFDLIEKINKFGEAEDCIKTNNMQNKKYIY